MKATGIVRRIDDLGRIVIPKEIRRTMRIREADPLEIFTNHEGEIILKKYSPIGELGQFAGHYADALAQNSGCLVCITDRDHVIAASGGGKKDFDGKPISKEMEAAIEENQNAQMAAGSDFTRLQQLTEELADLEARLEYKTERWMYLTELKEKIDAQGK